MEPPIQEVEEETEDDETPPTVSPPTVAESAETPQDCATRLRRVVQSGEYRSQYRELRAVLPRSGHLTAR